MSKRRGGILGVVRGYDGNNIHTFILGKISGREGEILQEENVILGTVLHKWMGSTSLMEE